MAWRTVWITDDAQLDGLQHDWEQLSALSPAPFGEHWWLRAWIRAFGDPRRLAICTLWEGHDLAGVFPLQRRAPMVSSASNAHTPAFRPLARDAAALARLTRSVMAASPLLVVSGLPAAEGAYAALRHSAAMGRRLEVIEPAYRSPLTSTLGSFEDYRNGMRSRWTELERRGRKLRREHAVELHAIAEPTALELELEAGMRVEASGWKGRAGTAILSQGPTAAFYREVAREAHERGILRFSSLVVDGRLAAFDLALMQYDRYFLLKVGYDEDLRRLAPGLILRRAVVERCFDDGLLAHEFLGPDMPWKRMFATGDREHVVYRSFARHPAGIGAFAYRRSVRPLAKRIALKLESPLARRRPPP